MKATASRACILIAGMHRSGTSALSRVVSLLGAAQPKTLMLAQPSNLQGHWESGPLSVFHDELLDSTGSSWDDWATAMPDWAQSQVTSQFTAKAVELFDEEFGIAPLTVFKDPRLCRLLPFWLPIFEQQNISPYIIVPIRNPKEVAASIAKRNGIDIHYNYLMWLRHVLEAEISSRNTKRVFVTYDDLLENYAGIVSNTEKRLGLKWPSRSVKTNEEIEAFLSNTYRNEKVPTKSLAGDMTTPDWVIQTYEIMLKWSATGEDRQDYEILDSIFADLNQSAQRFGRVVYRGKIAATELMAVKLELTDYQAKIADLSQQLIQSNQNLETATAHHAQESVTHAVLFREQAEVLGGSQSQLNILALEAIGLREQLSHLSDELDAVKQIAAARQQAIEQQQNEIVEAQVERRTALSLLEMERNNGRDTTDRLQAKLDTAIKNLTDREAEHSSQLIETQLSSAKMAEGFRASLDHFQQESRELAQKLQSAERELAVLEQTRAQQAAELGQLSSSLAQKKAEADDYLRDIEQFESEKNTLTQTIGALRLDIAASQMRGSRLASQIQGIVTSMEKNLESSLLPKRFKRAQHRDIMNAAGIVDTKWYLLNNPDVNALGLDPTLHYLTFGAAEGRSPNAEVDGVKKAGNP